MQCSKTAVALHHSMTSSARASSCGGTSMPSDLAVLRLMTSSYLVGACDCLSVERVVRIPQDCDSGKFWIYVSEHCNRLG
jgi:hypothetical protein